MHSVYRQTDRRVSDLRTDRLTSDDRMMPIADHTAYLYARLYKMTNAKLFCNIDPRLLLNETHDDVK